MKFSNSCVLWDSIRQSTLAPEGIVCKRPRSRLGGWSVRALVHESATTMGASTLSGRCLRPRRHHGNFFSRCLQLSSTRAHARRERPRSVLTPGRRGGPAIAGTQALLVHVTRLHTTCKFGRGGYDWADDAPGRRKSCSQPSAIFSIRPRGATS